MTSIEVNPLDDFRGISTGILALIKYDPFVEIFMDLESGEEKLIDPDHPLKSYCKNVTPDRTRIFCTPESKEIQVRDVQ